MPRGIKAKTPAMDAEQQIRYVGIKTIVTSEVQSGNLGPLPAEFLRHFRDTMPDTFEGALINFAHEKSK